MPPAANSTPVPARRIDNHLPGVPIKLSISLTDLARIDDPPLDDAPWP